MVSHIFGSALTDPLFTGKLLITSHVDGSSIGHRIPCRSPIMIMDKAIPLGTISAYGFLVLDKDDFLYLSIIESSWWLAVYTQMKDFSPLVLELCAGMGGMGIGAAFLGGIPCLSVDFNSLACQHLEANSHGQVLQLDLNSPDSARTIHRAFGKSPGTITFGFPCQPHSSQGMQLGCHDIRFKTFWNGLHVIFMSHPQSAILECVAAAGDTPEVLEGIHALADSMDWVIQDQDGSQIPMALPATSVVGFANAS